MEPFIYWIIGITIFYTCIGIFTCWYLYNKLRFNKYESMLGGLTWPLVLSYIIHITFEIYKERKSNENKR